MGEVAVVVGVSASNGLGAAAARRFGAGGLHVLGVVRGLFGLG